MTDPDKTPPSERRDDISTFLRIRRSRISPEMVNLPLGGRRRAPGLRREEVAMLADVSTTWYTWLEQGRPIRISARTLERIAAVLRLDEDETNHLFDLAGVTRKQAASVAPDLAELRSWIDSLGEVVAYVANLRRDLLLTNRGFDAIFGGPMLEDGLTSNIAEAIFVGGALRRTIVNFDAYAQHFVAHFRNAYGRCGDDPQFRSLIERCKTASRTFDELWSNYEVEEQGLEPLVVRFAHPQAGELVFSRIAFQPMRAHDAMIALFAPVESTGTREKVAAILEAEKPRCNGDAPPAFERVRV